MIEIEPAQLPYFTFDISNMPPWNSEPFGESIRYMLRISDKNRKSISGDQTFTYPDLGYVYCKTGYGLYGYMPGHYDNIKGDILYSNSNILRDANYSWQLMKFDYENCVHDHEHPNNKNVIRTPRAWICYNGDGETAYLLMGVRTGRIKSEYVNKIFSCKNLNISETDIERIRSEIKSEIVSRYMGLWRAK